ncbi:glutamine--fructose-6-phosphate transaminase (isomerizing) [Cupriavidus basilensis]|uniref:glutamine--fructose-6-phosphate transaminase (isomerizing) n=1 Tax=Cupriavidus sp. TaxID=1873897 RepID=UPI003D0C26E9
MCGIVGAIAQRNVTTALLEGLRRLEYRGYDSCGIAVLKEGRPQRLRSVSRVAKLTEQVAETGLSGTLGIAHTRWATHGAPATCNAHPIFSCGEIALVHNGIIENHEALRKSLSERGYAFESQTDTEVIAHLVHYHYHQEQGTGLLEAVRRTVAELHGAYAIAVFTFDQPDLVIGARGGSPLVVGLGEEGNYLASDAMALAGSANRFIYLEEGDMVALSRADITILNRDGVVVTREARELDAWSGAVELAPYQHYMQKEIFEQPTVIADRTEHLESIGPELFGVAAESALSQIDSLRLLACGTSYHSALTAKYWFESIARLPTQVEFASEYRYRDSVPNPNTLVVVVSQSGETADTLAALKHAQSLGHGHTLAICNVPDSAIVRQAGLHYLTRAGAEIGVASTKAFTTQLVGLFLLAVTLAKQRGRIDPTQEQAILAQLRSLPASINKVLALEPLIMSWADVLAQKENALFLGRGVHFPIALEGALKLKEISYIHAEAYAAGELKHGPLALVTDQMPVVTIAPNDTLLEKLKSNMQEVRARGGELYVLADSDTLIGSSDGVNVIRMPENYGLLSPVLHVVPLQLLAYHTACRRGTDVDKPRNLAKSVTVE